MISEETREYFSLGKRNDVRESAKRLRRQYLRYKDAEIVYSRSYLIIIISTYFSQILQNYEK